jgi:signal transduction histidine kinase/ActR/RegA family two-component response regulator
MPHSIHRPQTLQTTIKSKLQITAYISVVVLMANLNALVDSVIHPEISYFDEEHFIVGGVTAFVSALVFCLLLFYTRRIQKHAEELKNVQAQIIEQERLRALGQMASGIAHDFNNALVPILGYTELLLMRPQNLEDREKIIRYLQIMNTSAKDAASVVRRLREFYRQREENIIFFPVELDPLVQEVISLTQPRWKDQAQASSYPIEIHKELGGAAYVFGNASELREMFANLILNAVDAMPQGGIITFRTHNEGDQVVVVVSDTGIGMTAEIRNRCMEPFFSTKGTHGTGLGLAMVHGIIRRHEGSMDIKSVPGQGSIFTIRFPSFQGAINLETATMHANVVRPLHILVVDDEDQIRQLLTEYLIGDGHTVEVASDGSEALQKFNGSGFDLVLTDRAMPIMGGDQLTAAIKNLGQKKPVIIMLTGFGDAMASSGEIPDGVDLVLSKPVTLDSMREALTKVSVPALSA